eukprot:COSAG02_NODE_1175_length_14063_cov_24.197794_12_plen_466_part_00
MPSGRRRSSRSRAANQRRTRQGGRRAPAATAAAQPATTAADLISPAQIAELLRQGIVAGNPTVPLSLTDDNMDAVISEIEKIRVWNCSLPLVADSLDWLKESDAPEVLKCALQRTVMPGSFAHNLHERIVKDSVAPVLRLIKGITLHTSEAEMHDVAKFLMYIKAWDCTQQHILDMIPTLQEAGVCTLLCYTLEVIAHLYTTDGDKQTPYCIVSDPASFAAATNKLLVESVIESRDPGPSFAMWHQTLKEGLEDGWGLDAVAVAIEDFSDWRGTDEQAMWMLQAMRTSDVPPPIVEAFRKSACATTTVADSAEQAELGLQCGHAPDIEEAPLEPKTSACPDISPEPQPTECSTCCYPFAKEDLFGCRTEQCSYLQCASCILKGGGGACRNPECIFVHWECPACTEPGGGNAQLCLTDARFSKADVLLVLKTMREGMNKTLADAPDEIQATIAQFAQTVGQRLRQI